MLGKWVGRSRTSEELSADSIAALSPYAELAPADLEIARDLTRQVQVDTGLLNDQMPNDGNVFLHQGAIQIATYSGHVLLLRADQPQARFPMPTAESVVSLYAAEPSRFLIVPRPTETPTVVTDGLSQPPDLTAEEDRALAELRSYFREQRCELPSLPDLAIKIGKAIDDPNNANEDIARLIQLDPALTARLISVVNSAAFGAINKVSSINQATARLGRAKVRSLVYSCLLKGIFEINSAALKDRMESLWQHSVYVAALACVLGRETPGIDPEQALLAGLLHDIGAVAVIGGINRFPVLTRCAEVLDYIIDDLRVEIGLRTLNQWRLTSEFESVVRDAGQWQRTGSAIPENPDVVILARLHALIGSPSQAGLPRIDKIPAFCKLANGELSPRYSLNVLEEAEAEVREVRSLISGG